MVEAALAEAINRIVALESATNGYAGDMDQRMEVLRKEMDGIKGVIQKEHEDRMTSTNQLLTDIREAVTNLQNRATDAKAKEDVHANVLNDIQTFLGPMRNIQQEHEDMKKKMAMRDVGSTGTIMSGKHNTWCILNT